MFCLFLLLLLLGKGIAFNVEQAKKLLLDEKCEIILTKPGLLNKQVIITLLSHFCKQHNWWKDLATFPLEGIHVRHF